MIVVFSNEINKYPDLIIQQPVIELAVDYDGNEDRFSSNNDSMNEDQINQSNNFGLTLESECQMQIARNISVVTNFSLSVWQPPKVF